MPELWIADRPVGTNHEPLVVAELGINHEGSLETALEMAGAAISAGAEVIKHQTHIIDEEMSSEARTAIPGNASESIYEIMERCALTEAEEFALRDFVIDQGAIFMSTPFSVAAVHRIGAMELPAIKIGSGECANIPLIREALTLGKPMIVSTGMQTIETIRPTVDLIRKAGVPYALLHCTNLYPTPPHLVRLGALAQLQREFPDAVLGLSDHSESLYPCVAAVALGASILERHFTDRLDRPGPDISCSMTPEQLAELRFASRIVFEASGGEKGPAVEEGVTIAFAFGSVVSLTDLHIGDKLTASNIGVKRPSGGAFGPSDFARLLGHRVAIEVPRDRQLPLSSVQFEESDA
jgi:N-acetylneuraminate synthase